MQKNLMHKDIPFGLLIIMRKLEPNKRVNYNMGKLQHEGGDDDRYR